MSGGLYFGLILGVSAVIAIRNFCMSLKAEADIQKGIDPKVAIKYRRAWFHKKEESEAYKEELKNAGNS